MTLLSFDASRVGITSGAYVAFVNKIDLELLDWPAILIRPNINAKF